jgi:hypothetical protein
MRTDKTCKPVLETIGAFRRMLEEIMDRVGPTVSGGQKSASETTAPTRGLPPARKEAVCILTKDQDQWGVAYSTYVLAKQAGFDVEFQYATQPIRDAQLYLLPSLSGHAMISRQRLQELMAKVEQGATLYMSLDSGLPSDFEPITGLEPQTREKRCDFGPIQLQALGGQPTIPSGGEFKVRFKSTRAEVLGWEEDGNAAFTVAPYGKGEVYFLSVPVEMMATRTAGAFHHADSPAYWRVYRYFAQKSIADRIVKKQHPLLGVTEHLLLGDAQQPLDDSRCLVIAINHSPEALQDTLKLSEGWALESVLHGDADNKGDWLEAHVPGNDAAVLLLRRAWEWRLYDAGGSDSREERH